jgi:hypothetical protein
VALKARRSGTDRKWEELRQLLQNNPEIVDPEGNCHKIVIFSEHRNTISASRSDGCFASPKLLSRFTARWAARSAARRRKVHPGQGLADSGRHRRRRRGNQPSARSLDRKLRPALESQPFGTALRPHPRIGQNEVCHMWNLVAEETREGEVFTRILEKLEQERLALGGQVFDVMGKITFEGRPLRDLMIEAIRYGERPEVRDRLTRIVDEALDRDHLRDLIEERALAHDTIMHR